MENREKDIQRICNHILDSSPDYTGDYGTGTQCGYCLNMSAYYEQPLDEMEHEPDCIYLVAKDLSTGYNKN